MSVFSVLQYPLSDPPTVEQLEYLPPRLYYRIIDSMLGSNVTPEVLHSILGGLWLEQYRESYYLYMGAIRRMIYEYDEDK